MGDVTVLLERAHRDDVQARNELFASLYAELNRLASQKLAREAAFTQLDAPSLVHETYLRLIGQSQIPGENRRMFFAYAHAHSFTGICNCRRDGALASAHQRDDNTAACRGTRVPARPCR